MKRRRSTVARGPVFLLLLGAIVFASTGHGLGLVIRASAEASSYDKTWRIEVETTRFDPVYVDPNPAPSVEPTPSPAVYLTVFGTVTNISKQPINGDPAIGLQARDGQGRTYAPATAPDPNETFFPTFNPDIPTPFAIAFLVPTGASEFRLVSEDGSFDLRLPEPSAATPSPIMAEPTAQMASGVRLDPPLMMGGLGDVWDLELGDDYFWWQAVEFGWIERPSPQWVAEPKYGWFVVALDLGTMDGWLFTDFPYELFVLEDNQGNIYLPNLHATGAYCDAYCDMDIEQQDFNGWVGHTFHQAIVFDVPPSVATSFNDSGYTLRTLDGLIAVPIRR